ncbi:MAG: DNA-directed RNA polymerase subunit beta, partial [Chloroflexi bacterium]|nr:DNA-directed RNA polymerase subunit beta [Chloroflexota bacterium]
MASIPQVPPENSKSLVQRTSYAKLPQILEVPNLVRVQVDPFRWFQEEGLKLLLEEVSPIRDFTGNRLEVSFGGYEFRDPPHSEQECRQRDLTFSAPLYVKTRLVVKATGEIKEQDLFFGDLPLMTTNGTFITGGAERVVVSQLLRSPGVYFLADEDPSSGRKLCKAKLIPSHGAWLEFDTSNADVISVKINGKRKVPCTTLLRAIGFGSDEQLLAQFSKYDTSPEREFIRSTIERDPQVKDEHEALLSIYRRFGPGDPANLTNARRLIDNMFFNPLHYDLGYVGRYKLNKRLGLSLPENTRTLTKDDIVAIIGHIIMVNNGEDNPDDIDHLGNRRIRTVGELIQNQFRIGLMRLERVARERMSTVPAEVATPSALINIRPVMASIREFFGSSQLSQFMDQTNPLAELTHKRRLSAMGPKGLSRERAGFEVRDVHFSHYGRICPIETPEGPNIGLIGSLATYSRVNRYGFIETPYRRVVSEEGSGFEKLKGKTVREAVVGSTGKTTIKVGETITSGHIKMLAKLSPITVKVVPFVSDEVVYLPADEEDKYTIAQANARLDEESQFVDERVEARFQSRYLRVTPDNIDFMDVSPKQIFSVATSLIPFLEHDDANRALMGANMQRQAVPLLAPKAPLVATGMEGEAARYSGQIMYAHRAGIISSVTGNRIVIETEDGEQDVYPLMKFVRTNQG